MQNPMRYRNLMAGCVTAAILLAAGLPDAARAQSSPDLTSELLIKILVKKGVLSQSDANSIMHEAQAEASAAQTASRTPAAAPSPARESAYAANTAPGATETTIPAPSHNAPTNTVSVSTTETPDGTIHVTYIPQVVRDQIATSVEQQVMAQQQAQGYSGKNLVPDWVNRIHFYGDFRMRLESDMFPPGNDITGGLVNFNSINTGPPYDVSPSNTNFPPQLDTNQNRFRLRLRARLGLDADLGEGFTAGLRIATGENDSPVTENQTLGLAPNGSQGGNFSKYAIWLDRAYLAYTPPLDSDFGLKLIAGRFDNPFFSTNLIWADDLGFDGVAAHATYQVDDGIVPFFTAGAFPVYNTDLNFASNQPQKFPSTNKWLIGVQGGTSWKFNDDYATKLGIAGYFYTNVAGKLSAPCTVNSASDQCSTDSLRPSFAQNGNTYMALRDIIPTAANNFGQINQYQYFGLASQFTELALTGEFDVNNFDPTDIWLNGEYVVNLAFNQQSIAAKAVNNRGSVTSVNNIGPYVGGNQGFYINANVGQKILAKRWDWNAMIGYKYIQSDAVVDAFDDSDFGLGGTNLEGYIVGGNLALSQRVWVRLRYMSADSIAGPTYRNDVVQLDLNAKF
jgi:hypothetical protein